MPYSEARSESMRRAWEDPEKRARLLSNRRHERRIKEMSPVEAAWVGAIIEGEGHALKGNTPSGSIRVTNTDVEIISALLRVTGVGNVYLKPEKVNKDCWVWDVSASADVLSLAEQIAPYSVKARSIPL